MIQILTNFPFPPLDYVQYSIGRIENNYYTSLALDAHEAVGQVFPVRLQRKQRPFGLLIASIQFRNYSNGIPLLYYM